MERNAEALGNYKFIYRLDSCSQTAALVIFKRKRRFRSWTAGCGSLLPCIRSRVVAAHSAIGDCDKQEVEPVQSFGIGFAGYHRQCRRIVRACFQLDPVFGHCGGETCL